MLHKSEEKKFEKSSWSDQYLHFYGWFTDDLVVDVMEKMVLVSYISKKYFIKVKKKVWALQKPLVEGCKNGNHLLKKSGWSEKYLYF